MQEYIALKMGSSHTSIYRQGDGIVLYEPSLVAYSGIGKNKNIKAIGSKAKRISGRSAEDTITISPIFEGIISDSELASVMLKSFISRIFPKRFVKPRIKAICCIPLGTTLEERKIFERVCYNSQIQEVSLIPSVLCAGVGYNLPISSPSGTLVVNIGGGSTDIAVISLSSIVVGVNIGIGGEHLDVAVQRYVLDKFNLIISKSSAEVIKTEVGSLYSNDSSSTEVVGIDNETKLSRTDVVTSTDVYAAVEHFYGRIADAIQGVINTCSPDIVADINNNGMYLLGGGAAITGAEQYFRRKLNIKVTLEDYTNAIDVIGAGKLLSDPKLQRQLEGNL